jgi:molecular chaperone GrpE
MMTANQDFKFLLSSFQLERMDMKMTKHDTAKKGARKEPLEVEAEIPATDLKNESANAVDEVNPVLSEASADNQDAADSDEAMESVDEQELFSKEIETLKELACKKEAEAKEHYDRLTHMAADFDNYRRRTQKEKERLFGDAAVEVAALFIPVLDNLERAVKAAEKAEDPAAVSLRDGVSMVVRQCGDAMAKLGIREIEALGAPFNPAYHNAVLHVEDETCGPSVVTDVFQKGYLFKEDTVVRHAMVKVAN